MTTRVAVAAPAAKQVAASAPVVMRKACCDKCDDDEPLMRSPLGAVDVRGLPVSQPGDDAEVEADRAADAALRGPAIATAPVPARSNTAHASGGEPLPIETRRDLEPRFGHSFADVRVFHDAAAAGAARAVDARAFTLGRAIVFGAAQWAPSTATGRQLIAHELAHVVQQHDRPALQRMVFRNKCGHDAATGSGCAGLGTVDDLTGVRTLLALDTLIVQSGLRHKFPGTWASQVYSPPNAAKGGSKFGKIDALKVKESASLDLEVLEIKSRNTTGYGSGGEATGGCAVASNETVGYVAALTPLRKPMADLSGKLSAIGGYMLAGGASSCRSAAAVKQLRTAGVDTTDPTTMTAWCVYNSIQDRIGKTFTTAFTAVNVTANSDGTAATTADEGDEVVRWPVSCPKVKGKPRKGFKRMVFQVNTAGGLSYRCEKRCDQQEEEEERKEQRVEVPAEKAIEKDKQRTLPIQELQPDYDPLEDGAELPPEGVDVTDVVVVSLAGTAAVYTAHKAYQAAANAAERRAAEVLRDRALAEMRRRGAGEAAKMLNSKNIVNFGKKAFEKGVDKADDVARRLAKGVEKQVEKKLAKQLGKKVAKKALEKGARYLPVVGWIVTAVGVLGMLDNVAHGAELGIGLGGDEVDLSGTTQIGKQPQSGDAPTLEGSLHDTKIELEVDKVPGAKGSIRLDADNVTISGKPAKDGDTITVDLTLKLKNTRITIRRAGVIKGKQIVISGELEILDSDIEIDLPEGTTYDPSDGAGTTGKKVLKGVKIKITKLGHGGGTTTTDVDKPEGKGGADDKAADKPAEPPLSAEAQKLLADAVKDPNTKKIADAILVSKGIKLTEELLRRLVALKEGLARHPELADQIIKGLKEAPLTDPLAQLIVPMEEALKRADKNQPMPTTTGDTPGTTDQPVKDPPATTGTTTTPKVEDRSTATALDFAASSQYMRFPRAKADRNMPKHAPQVTGLIVMTRQTPAGERVYRFGIKGTFVEAKAVKGALWGGVYDFTVPSSLIKSESGDQPIYFTDTAKPFRWTFFVTPPK